MKKDDKLICAAKNPDGESDGEAGMGFGKAIQCFLLLTLALPQTTITILKNEEESYSAKSVILISFLGLME